MKMYQLNRTKGDGVSTVGVFATKKEAAEAMMMELTYEHNEDLDSADEKYLTPFDFTLKEIESYEFNEDADEYFPKMKPMENNLKVGDRVRNKRTGSNGTIVMIPHPDYRMNWVKVLIVKEPAIKYKTCWAIRNIELINGHDEKGNQQR